MKIKKLTTYLFFCWVFLCGVIQTSNVFAKVLSPISIENKLSSIFEQNIKTINLTEALILISKDWNPSLNEISLKNEINDLIESVKNKLTAESSAQETVNILRQVIHEEKGYRYTDKVDKFGIPTNKNELFLHGMLKTKNGYCMNLSLLYLIIADKLNLPIYGVGLPNHFFVRYESERTRINIETTESGASYPDSFYENRFGLKFEKKTPFFTQSLNKKQSLGAYLSNIGMVYYKNSRPKKSIFYLKPSTEINPLSIEAHNNLANIYGEIKQHNSAIYHYQKALKSDPNNTSTLFNLGQTYIDISDTDRAIEVFLQVVQIQPTFTRAHRQLIDIYLKTEKYISALLHLKRIIKIDTNDTSAHISIGQVYTKLKKFKLAIESLEPIKSRHPNNIEALEALAELFYKMGNLDRSITEYRNILGQNSKHLPSYIQLGWVHYRKGEFQMATAWTKRGLKLGAPSSKITLLADMNLGLYSWLNGDHASAKNFYRNALEKKSKDITKAILDDLKETTRLFPKRIESSFFTGWVYAEVGKNEMALHHLNRFIALAPDSKLANEARLLIKKGLPSSATKITSDNKIKTPLSKVIPKNMVLIPGGFFIMGSNDHGQDESPEHKTYLDPYYIDRYEVSASSFALFLNEVNNVNGYYLDNKFGTLFFNGKYLPRKGFENHPINNIKWQGAYEYCRSKGKRLPTEAEWEKAARGENGKIYPWGNKLPTNKLARYRQTWSKEVKHHVMVPVDTFKEGASTYGIHHMAGNIKEWVDDWFDREYYDNPANHINPKGQIGGKYKVLRGGSWRDLRGFIYSSYRNNSYSSSRLDDYGFRCVKSSESSTGLKQLTLIPKQTKRLETYARY